MMVLIEDCHDSRRESTSQAIKTQVDCIYKFYLIYKINKIYKYTKNIH